MISRSKWDSPEWNKNTGKRKKMKPPKKGGKPKKIGSDKDYPPGGPKTPGAKGTYPKKK